MEPRLHTTIRVRTRHHPGTGALCAGLSWSRTGPVQHLASRFTVFNYDRRGRGDSGDTLPFAIEREIDDIEALIDEAGGRLFVWSLFGRGPCP